MIRYHAGATSRACSSNASLLAEIVYGAEHRRDAADPRRIVVGMPPIGDHDRESWCLPGGTVQTGWAGDIGYALGDGYLFAHLLAPEHAGTSLAELTRDAYRRLLAFVRDGPCPELFRVWNHLARINADEQGMERYQAFCKGRAEAFAEAGIPARRFPAATAIGSRAPGLSVHLLAGSRPGEPIENPRQLSAYRYPPPYGPRSPTFARAIDYSGPRGGRELAISGTASIVGHVTMHPMNLDLQLRETVRNLHMLIAGAGLAARPRRGSSLLLKVYLRDPSRVPRVEPVLRGWAGPEAQIMFLQGAICRRELQIEIEGHCSVPSCAGPEPRPAAEPTQE
jgi:chorismate lyase/3-hydroxybenzoate synthase